MMVTYVPRRHFNATAGPTNRNTQKQPAYSFSVRSECRRPINNEKRRQQKGYFETECMQNKCNGK